MGCDHLIRKRIVSAVLSLGLIVSPFAGTVASYAAERTSTDDVCGKVTSGALSGAQVRDENPAAVGEVTGEAIVCFRQEEDTDNKSETSVKKEQEKEIESESYVDDAEAILLVDSPEETLAESEDASAETADPDKAEAAEASDADTTEDLASDDGLPGVITLVQSDHLSTDELIAELEARDDVIYAEPNYIYRPQSMEDFTGDQWGPDSTYGIGVDGWNTYNEGKPSPKVDTSKQVIAIVDTGVDYNHVDLKDVMWDEGENYPELVKLGGGKYGYTGTRVNTSIEPYNSADPMDDQGHGTHCAGIAAAAWNGVGVSGIASGARIMALKASNEKGSFAVDSVIRAYNYMITAKKAGVNICSANNSFGGAVSTQTELLLLAEATKAGIVCCFAAGNDSRDLDSTNATAAMRAAFPQVLVVGASDTDGSAAEFSNYGRRDVDIFAPGVRIISTIPMGKGTPSETTSPFTDGGNPCVVDYSEKTTFGDDVMGLQTGEGTVASIRKGVDDKNVLHLVSEDGSFILRTKKFSDLTELKGGVLRVYVAEKCSASISAETIDDDGPESIGSRDVNLIKGWNDVGFLANEFFDGSEKPNNSVEITLSLKKDKDAVTETDVRFVRLANAAEDFMTWNGTSMATPHITGAVAVLAAAFPEDSAAKLAARVTGSVMPISEMKDLCLSGGVFRLDKALAGETVPVPQAATAENGTVTVQGFFFGTSKGSLTIAGKTCEVTSWSDEKITAKLPADLPEGESVVEVTSSKGAGHNYFVFSKAEEQYDSLPLPGAAVADNGLYESAEKAIEEYPDFYYGTLTGMTALNGSLYVLFVSKDDNTVIYQYEIKTKTWKRVYSGGDYAPVGAVCNWDGKVLFLASNQPKESSAIAVFDPDTGKVTWKQYRNDAYEYGHRMVNTGAGIYLIGGNESADGDNPRNQAPINYLRKLDPTTMTITTFEGEPIGIDSQNPVIAAASEDTFYVMRGSGYIHRNQADMFKVTVDPEGKKEPKADTIENNGKIFPGMDLEGDYNAAGIATKKGLLVTGPARTDSNGNVVEDTYLVSYDGQSCTAMDKVVSRRPMYLMAAAGYDGKCYILGQTRGSDTLCVFTAIDAETLPTVGEKTTPDEPVPSATYSNEWVKGVWYDSKGVADTGRTAKWKKNKTGWYYIDTKGWYPKSQWLKVDGKNYWFNAKGYMASNEWVKGKWFNKDGTQTYKYTGKWKKNKTGWYYIDTKGWYPKKQWQKIDGKWYWFDAKGYMAENEYIKGWWCGKGGAQTYKYKASWKKNKTGWYYIDTNGWYAKKQTLKIDGVKYTFDAAGYLK